MPADVLFRGEQVGDAVGEVQRVAEIALEGVEGAGVPVVGVETGEVSQGGFRGAAERVVEDLARGDLAAEFFDAVMQRAAIEGRLVLHRLHRGAGGGDGVGGEVLEAFEILRLLVGEEQRQAVVVVLGKAGRHLGHGVFLDLFQAAAIVRASSGRPGDRRMRVLLIGLRRG